MTSEELISETIDLAHVVILGAGASRAAFPQGDPLGNRLPLMDDLVDVLELHSVVKNLPTDLASATNFETLYSQLQPQPEYADVVAQMECRVNEYFGRLVLPETATVYDRLLLALRPSDSVFTFNWDPFLFDAYLRNLDVVPLPSIYFLHGNVRIAQCQKDDCWGPRGNLCPSCGQKYQPVPLLFPVENKDYDSNTYIRSVWKEAEELLSTGFTMTIFGYGAPDSDIAAVGLMHSAWMNRNERQFEHIEIIDTASTSTISDRWGKFTPTHHYHHISKFEDSRIANWPRRSSESLFFPMSQGIPCENFPMPQTDDLADIQKFAAQISKREARD